MTTTYMTASYENYNFRNEKNIAKKDYAISGFPSKKDILAKIGQWKLSFCVKSYISIV